jgi:virginiamycin A acetyltransferase
MTAREVAKTAARGAAQVAVAPFLLSFAVRAAVLGQDRALQASSQALSLVPGLAGVYLRRAFLMRTIAACHKTVVVEFGTTLSRSGAKLDENAYIGPGCHLGLVHVERDVLMAGGVHVPSGANTHRIDDMSRPIREQPNAERFVRIGAGSWIGEAAVIMADIGLDSVIGAGAVVTRPVPPRSVAAGVPARVLRTRGNERARAVTTPTLRFSQGCFSRADGVSSNPRAERFAGS